MITAEVAIYPLKTDHAPSIINHSIDALKQANVQCTVDSMKTHLSGTKEEVFDGLNHMFTAAQTEGGEISMVVTLTNAVN